MRSPEERDGSVPDILAGRRVRRVDVSIAPGLDLFILEAADPDIVLEEALRDDGDPYAAILWPSAIATATRLADIVRPGDLVLDVGAGTGLAALAAARLGATATALDRDPFARVVIAEAARIQRIRVRVIAGDIASSEPLPRADIVVMADLLYEPELARRAARHALAALARGARVLVGDPGRYGRRQFEAVLRDAGIEPAFEHVVARAPGEPRPAHISIALIEPRS